MQEYFAYITAKPFFGLTVTASSFILKWMGLLTPYLAFVGVCLGVTASLYSIRVNQLNKRKVEKELEKLK